MSAISLLTDVRNQNEERVLSVLREHAALSRAEIADRSGISYPTVSKILSRFLQTELIDEREDAYSGFGRPRKVYHLVNSTRSIFGLVIGPFECELVVAGCDGKIDDQSTFLFKTPRSYSQLIKQVSGWIQKIVDQYGSTPLGLGVTVPGLVDREARVIRRCPNLHMLEEKELGKDLNGSLGIPVTIVQCMHGLFLAERMFGVARELENFILLNQAGGIGLSICVDGKYVQGANGYAGEIGHTVVDSSKNANPCGCGKRGCLETYLSDVGIANAVSKRLGRTVSIQNVINLVEAGSLEIDDLLERGLGYLAREVAMLINLFNPEALFLMGLFWKIVSPELRTHFSETVQSLALDEIYSRCRMEILDRRPQEAERRSAIASSLYDISLSKKADRN